MWQTIISVIVVPVINNNLAMYSIISSRGYGKPEAKTDLISRRDNLQVSLYYLYNNSKSVTTPNGAHFLFQHGPVLEQ